MKSFRSHHEHKKSTKLLRDITSRYIFAPFKELIALRNHAYTSRVQNSLDLGTLYLTTVSAKLPKVIY